MSATASSRTKCWAGPKTLGSANPAMPIYVAYFAFLFLVPRWWRQTEYTRSTRMSLWCVDDRVPVGPGYCIFFGGSRNRSA